jgi:hypothetical protein
MMKYYVPSHLIFYEGALVTILVTVNFCHGHIFGNERVMSPNIIYVVVTSRGGHETYLIMAMANKSSNKRNPTSLDEKDSEIVTVARGILLSGAVVRIIRHGRCRRRSNVRCNKGEPMSMAARMKWRERRASTRQPTMYKTLITISWGVFLESKSTFFSIKGIY